MRPAAKFLVLLAVALCFGQRSFSQNISGTAHGQLQSGAISSAAASLSAPIVPDPAAISTRGQIARHAMGLEGDYSLNLVTIVEQGSARSVHYVVRLQFASGAEQSIAVTAPPGGLQLEMRDMTGDKIPNDLLLTPALLTWAPAVLINDGHDHFTVAISGAFPGSLGSDDRGLSEAQDVPAIAALLSSGFEAGPANERNLFPPELQTNFLSVPNQVPEPFPCSCESERAPPAS